MKLEISKDSMYADKSFLQWLIKFFKVYYYAERVKTDFSLYDNYMAANIKSKVRLNSADILVAYFNNLIILENEEQFTIQVNPVANVPRTLLKLKDIAKLINDGNLDLKGLHVVDKIFDKIADNIRSYYQLYSGVI